MYRDQTQYHNRANMEIFADDIKWAAHHYCQSLEAHIALYAARQSHSKTQYGAITAGIARETSQRAGRQYARVIVQQSGETIEMVAGTDIIAAGDILQEDLAALLKCIPVGTVFMAEKSAKGQAHVGHGIEATLFPEEQGAISSVDTGGCLGWVEVVDVRPLEGVMVATLLPCITRDDKGWTPYARDVLNQVYAMPWNQPELPVEFLVVCTKTRMLREKGTEAPKHDQWEAAPRNRAARAISVLRRPPPEPRSRASSTGGPKTGEARSRTPTPRNNAQAALRKKQSRWVQPCTKERRQSPAPPRTTRGSRSIGVIKPSGVRRTKKLVEGGRRKEAEGPMTARVMGDNRGEHTMPKTLMADSKNVLDNGMDSGLIHAGPGMTIRPGMTNTEGATGGHLVKSRRQIGDRMTGAGAIVEGTTRMVTSGENGDDALVGNIGFRCG